tara:strand:- start:160 stop:426 length:267 start_codon:yes stop_codon:yes gene_type:complete
MEEAADVQAHRVRGDVELVLLWEIPGYTKLNPPSLSICTFIRLEDVIRGGVAVTSPVPKDRVKIRLELEKFDAYKYISSIPLVSVEKV